MKINKVQQTHMVREQPTYPAKSIVCSKCGMKWEGVMGYVCQHLDCPVQFKAVSRSQTPNNASWYNIEGEKDETQ